VNADGSVSIAPGTLPGNYAIEYTICEVSDAGNCDTATVTVTIEEAIAKIIDAVDDSYTAVEGTDGTILDSNVLGNDTLEGVAASLDAVVITSTPTPELTVNADGSVSVSSSALPG